MKRTLIIAIAVIIAALVPAGAGAKQDNQQVKRERTAPPGQITGHVACTKYGCFPVAPNCRPQTQLDWWGNPTGYDQIVCRPPRR